jgi:hypothetical protein
MWSSDSSAWTIYGIAILQPWGSYHKSSARPAPPRDRALGHSTRRGVCLNLLPSVFKSGPTRALALVRLISFSHVKRYWRSALSEQVLATRLTAYVSAMTGSARNCRTRTFPARHETI